MKINKEHKKWIKKAYALNNRDMPKNIDKNIFLYYLTGDLEFQFNWFYRIVLDSLEYPETNGKLNSIYNQLCYLKNKSIYKEYYELTLNINELISMFEKLSDIYQEGLFNLELDNLLNSCNIATHYSQTQTF